jgi:hypothetical protein
VFSQVLVVAGGASLLAWLGVLLVLHMKGGL